jgi:peptidyl-dipeptidase A
VADLGEESFQRFAEQLELRLAELSQDAAVANYDASISGAEEDYTRSAAAQLALETAYSDAQTFARLKEWKEAGTVSDPVLARQLEVLYLAYLGNQLPEPTLAELVGRASEIEKRFNTHRALVDGRELSDNEIAEILRKSTVSADVETAWLASKEVGAELADQILELVRLRNQAAHELGFDNFHVMQLALTEQDPAEIEALFDELDLLTRDEFARAKAEIDAFQAARFGITTEELRPWHYQNPFFQEAPTIYPVDLDAYYAEADLVQLTADYYAGLGLPVDDVIARSDLFGKPGKYQHAFCEDVDRSGDVRVLCSITPNYYWMNTMLHEFGHGIYSKYNDPELPWSLRDAAHSFTTEAIANLFGRFAANPDWLHDVAGISVSERDRIREAAGASLRLEQLVFSRWSQVMFRFEKALYEDPEQGLNTLWWDLVERYQLLQRPEGRDEADWAAKIHVALYPAYYHNYLMGELLASQLVSYINREVLQTEESGSTSFSGRAEVGTFLRDKVFEPGRSLPWNEMILRAAGEELNPSHYAAQFMGPSS